MVYTLENGFIRFDFSESLFEIHKLWPESKNMTLLNENKDDLFEIIYTSNNYLDRDEQFQQIVPQIKSWNIINWNQFYFDLSI